MTGFGAGLRPPYKSWFWAVREWFRRLVQAVLVAVAAPVLAAGIVTVYLQRDGCGQFEYTELQLPDSQVVCTAAGCQALINGAWRAVLLKRP